MTSPAAPGVAASGADPSDPDGRSDAVGSSDAATPRNVKQAFGPISPRASPGGSCGVAAHASTPSRHGS